MSQAITILNVEDDDTDADILARALNADQGGEFQLHRAKTLADAPHAIAAAKPDLILLDLHLPDARGKETVDKMMRHAAEIPVLVLTGSGSEQVGRMSVEAGAQDFIPKAELMTTRLLRSIDFAIRRKRLQSDTEKRASTDPLTGLLNRESLIRHLGSATAHVRRHGGGFALAFVDLDGFKAINDRHGHEAGDALLIEIARRAQAVGRANDYLYRLGGDEFVFFLDGVSTRAKARQAGVRYAASIEKPAVLNGPSGPVRVAVTASTGLALCPKDTLDPKELLAIADQAMYDRKRVKHEQSTKLSATIPTGQILSTH
jgi:two-component system, cell cycle response regulator